MTTAQEIIQEVTPTEEGSTLEEEFRQLHLQSQEMIHRLKKVAERLKKKGRGSVTYEDLAEVYLTLAEDVIPMQRDHIAADGGAFEEIIELLDSQDEDGEADDDEDEITPEVLHQYATFQANVKTLEQILSIPDFPSESRKSMENLLGMNQQSIVQMDEKYGEDLKQEMEQVLVQAQAQEDNL